MVLLLQGLGLWKDQQKCLYGPSAEKDLAYEQFTAVSVICGFKKYCFILTIDKPALMD